MTNTEIVEQIYDVHAVKELATTWDEMMLGDKEVVIQMLDAAREDEAIRFAEWIKQNLWWFDYWTCKDGSVTTAKVWNNDSANPVNYTTKQLYALYKKQNP